MRILAVSNHWGVKDNKTYAGYFVDRQIKSLRKIGYEVDCFDVGINHSPWLVFRRLLALREQARSVDIVHARYGTLVAFLSVLSGKPTIITFAGSDLLPGASISKLRTYVGIFLSNFASLFASAIICVSEELKQALWWKKSVAMVIPNGVDLSVFTPGDQMDARRQLGWEGSHPIIIINAARDPENKGLPLAVEAMKFVKIELPEAELIVIQGIKPDDMYLCYRAADVLISPSRQEGSANVIKEAMACNLPVVSSPVGDARERLSGVHPSFVVPRDSSLMSKALIEILTKPERSNGREKVLELGLENIAQLVSDVYLAVYRKRIRG